MSKKQLFTALAPIVVLMVAAWPVYQFLDAKVLEGFVWLNINDRDPWLQAFGQLGNHITLIWVLLLIAWARNRPQLVTASVAAMVLAGLAVTVLKICFHRIRPDEMMEALAAGTAIKHTLTTSYSFPSGDTMVAFAGAAVAAAFMPRRYRWLPYGLGVIVALIRMSMLRHYPSDVLAGAAIGLLCAAGALAIQRRWFTWTFPRWWRTACFAGLILFPFVLLPFTRAFENRLLTVFNYGILNTFMPGLGPLMAAILAATMLPAWLRWGGRCDAAGRVPPGIGLVIVCLAAMAIVPSLGGYTLYDRDEGYYVECARQMLVSGNWFVPYFAGEPWMEKPPLAFWLMAVSMRTFGVNEFAARLPSALCGLAAIWLTFRLAREMIGLRAGIIASVVATTCLFFNGTMRIALVDMPMVASTTLSMLGLWGIIRGERWRGPLLFYVGAGLAMLTKGPLGLALPVLALGGYILLTRRWDFIARARPFLGMLVVLVIISLWVIPAIVFTGMGYFHEMIWVRTIQPVFSPLQGHGGKGLVEYLLLIPIYIPILFVGFIPWSAFLWPAIRHVAAQGRTATTAAFLLGWVLAQLIALSLISTKLQHYVLPIIPALAICMGAYLAQRPTEVVGKTAAGGLAKVFGIGGLILAAFIMAVPFVTGFSGEWPWFIPAALMCLLGGRWAAGAVDKRHTDILIMRLAVVITLVLAALCDLGIPRLETGKSAKRVATKLQSLVGSFQCPVRVGAVGYREMSLVFYLRQDVKMLDSASEIGDFLDKAGAGAVVVNEKEWARIPADMAARYHAIWRLRAWIPDKGSWIDLHLVVNDAFLAEDQRLRGKRN